MTLVTKPGIYEGMSALDYHADCVDPISLNSTVAKKLIAFSAAHARAEHPKLGGKDEGEEEVVDPKATKAKERGTLIHRLVIGRGGQIEVLPFENFRKDVAKAARDLSKAQGKIPTLPHLLEEAQEAADAARAQLDDMGYQSAYRAGIKEVVIVWKEGDIFFRAMIDELTIDENSKTATIRDLKTTKCSHPKACTKQIENMGYDIGMAFYMRGLAAVRPDLAGRIKGQLDFLEWDKPFALTPIEMSAEWMMGSDARVETAINKWRECIASNKWPFYVKGLTRIDPNPWHLVSAFTDE